MAVKVEVTGHGEREWVSADAMDRQVQLRQAAEQQRDRLLEAVKKFIEAPPSFSGDERLRLWRLAEQIESEVGNE